MFALYNHGFPNTFDYNHYVYSDYLVCSETAIAHIIPYMLSAWADAVL